VLPAFLLEHDFPKLNCSAVTLKVLSRDDSLEGRRPSFEARGFAARTSEPDRKCRPVCQGFA
jgi:hypothetical protein